MNDEERLLQKYLEEYRKGLCSVDKAVEEVGITVSEMMKEVVNAGIKSNEKIDEYNEGLKLWL